MLNSREQFFQQITNEKKLALAFNRNWSGDSLSAGLALSALLTKLGKKITLASDHSAKQNHLEWLPNFSAIQSELENAKFFIISLDTIKTKIKNLKYRLTSERLDIVLFPEAGSSLPEQITTHAGGFAYNTAIILGCSDLDSLGSLYTAQPAFWQETSLINIDASPANEAFGQINLINPKASSVSEIVWQLFSDKLDLIDANIATCLLAGIIMATNNFKSANLSPQTLSVAADLINLGARREEIINQLYRNKKFDTLQIWGSALTELSVSGEAKLAWTKLNFADFKSADLKRQDLIALAEELIGNLPSLEIVIIFIAKGAQTLAFVYSLKNFDALNLISSYQGQGDKKLAQALINRPLEETIKELVPAINKQII